MEAAGIGFFDPISGEEGAGPHLGSILSLYGEQSREGGRNDMNDINTNDLNMRSKSNILCILSCAEST